MSIVAEFTIPAEALPAGDLLVERPDVRIEVERIVPTQESALPFVWVWGTDPEAFLEQAERESDITGVDVLDRVEGGALCRVEWSPEAEPIQGIRRLNATIIEATGTSEHWRFEVRTQEREAFIEFRELFQQAGIPIRLDRLYDLTDLVDGSDRQLTPEQREAVIAAYRDGYFEKPRQITQEELGEQFGISHRAVAERLRRGMRNLVAATLLPDGERT